MTILELQYVSRRIAEAAEESYRDHSDSDPVVAWIDAMARRESGADILTVTQFDMVCGNRIAYGSRS